ncbi:Glyoxysomal fatty acid beta-oxidation multifunctional protein MFP-a [Scenedesmus sp. PABB004]|nr:Glyoxysomal fatty acid beta-oxidation multifunctional protein MFP-a [Scenedesmus sp. PABB004]
MAPAVEYRAEPDGVALITLSNPPVNALHPDVLSGLFDALRRAHADPAVAAVVVAGRGGTFSAGFDIAHVAAIAGAALGGGLEVALACNARVAAPGARLGLPELQLGIIPGFGGTQRLPRVVGLARALPMMLTSAPLRADAALKAGLVDAVVPVGELLAVARARALDIAAGRLPRLASLTRTDRLEPYGEAVAVIALARAQAARRTPHLAHPQLCLDAVEAGVARGGEAGLAKEGEAFAAAAALDTHKALVHVFFATRATKKVSGVTDAGLTPRRIARVAVLGGGLMGSGIATALVLSGLGVVLKEVNAAALEAGLGRVRANLSSRVRKGRMSQADADAALARVTGALDYAAFGGVDMVIEAALEDVALKQAIFADLEASCPPHAILATNTSTIDIDLVAARLQPATRARVLGAHFFSPAHVMPLLEIVRTRGTGAQAVLDTLALAGTLRKTPVVVGNCTGFAVNRVFFPYTMAACLLADLGADPYAVDRAVAGFGMPMGPFRLSDLVGSDIGLHVGRNFAEAFPERVYASGLFPTLVAARRLGEKSGAGFYKFDASRRASPDPALRPLLEASVASAGLLARVHGGTTPRMSPQEVVEFLFFPVVNEGCRVVAERVVDKPGDLDVATVMAMGFPAFRGGLLFWADLVGAAAIAAKLTALAERFRGVGLAGFFEPCDYLAAAAASGRRLGDGPAPAARL